MKYASFAFGLGILVSGLASTPALAAIRTASFTVTVTVMSSCQISAPASAFGTHMATGASATSSVSVTCTNPTPYNVSLSNGLSPSATVFSPKTPGTALDSLNSALLLNSAHTVNWARTAGYGSFPTRLVLGRSAGAQSVAPGAFADSVTITVTY